MVGGFLLRLWGFSSGGFRCSLGEESAAQGGCSGCSNAIWQKWILLNYTCGTSSERTALRVCFFGVKYGLRVWRPAHLSSKMCQTTHFGRMAGWGAQCGWAGILGGVKRANFIVVITWHAKPG